MSYPLVTILCPTYGRPRQLEELLASFLRQTVTDAQLVIVNDCPWQKPVFNHPRVIISNLPNRFPTFGDKRNSMLAMMNASCLVTFWDDDDIYLPGYLSYSLANHKRFATPVSKHHRQWNDRGVSKYRITGAGWMNTVIARRGCLTDAGGFDSVHNGSCVGIIRRLVKAGHLVGPGEWDGVQPSFIYRSRDGKNHVSTQEPDRAYASMDDFADQEEGTIQLLPHWHEDYVAKADASWEAVQRVAV